MKKPKWQREFTGIVNRNAAAIMCDCGGYAERVNCTEAELEQYNCHRKYECCARAFICVLCNQRWVGRAEAPEMDYD